MLISRYIFRQTASALIIILVSLTLIVWLISILREIKLMTSQGQTFLLFLKITSLAIPNLLVTVAPVAFLIATLHTLNRLAGDSELIVLSASGSSAWRLLTPYMTLAMIVFVVVLVSNMYFVPRAARLLGDHLTQIRTDILSQVLQPGEFSELDKGMMFHIRDRDQNGDLLGVVVYDQRDKKMTTTVIAERGEVYNSEGRSIMNLRDGQILRQPEGKTEAQIVAFQSYLFDIGDLAPKQTARELKPRERDFGDLINPDVNNAYYRDNKAKFVSELHERLSAPLYAPLFALLALLYLGRPRTTREGRGGLLFSAFAIGAVFRIVGIASVSMAGKKAWAVGLLYGLPILGMLAVLAMLALNVAPPSLSLPAIRLPWPLRLTGRNGAASVANPS